jgi:DNA (cytosine-5)-methyltransferase 1
MRLLDLFCGSGGSSVGFHRAGFEVVGVDIKPQPRYPFEFIQANAFEYLIEHWREFDIFGAGPPCQAYSVTAPLSNGNHPTLVGPVRELLQATGKPYIIENVPGAPLINPLMLCGTMFSLRVLRHRLFECHPVLWWPPAACCHWGKVAPCFGAGAYDKSGYEFVTVAGKNCPPSVGGPAMGIDWMTGRELSQAIPPAYTEYVGKKIRELI